MPWRPKNSSLADRADPLVAGFVSPPYTAAMGAFIRVLTLNIWNTSGPYEARREMLRDGIAALAPDLMAFQEAMHTPRDQVAELLEGTGYHVLHQIDARPDSRWDQGCCVASRWPLECVEVLPLDVTENARSYPYAALAVRVAAPEPPGLLLFVCCKPSWELNRERERELQALEIARLVRRHADPHAFPPIVAGDFDATPDSSSIRFLTGRQSLEITNVCFRDAWAEAGDGGPGYTWTDRNGHARDIIEQLFFEKRHARRIDYVFLGSFHDYPRFARIGACRIVLDTPVGRIWPSDHYGVLAEIDVER